MRSVLGFEYRSSEYMSVSGEKYLVEVNVTHSNRIPDDWIRVNQTKRKIRVRSPSLHVLYNLLQQTFEKREMDAVKAWTAFLEYVFFLSLSLPSSLSLSLSPFLPSSLSLSHPSSLASLSISLSLSLYASLPVSHLPCFSLSLSHSYQIL